MLADNQVMLREIQFTAMPNSIGRKLTNLLVNEPVNVLFDTNVNLARLSLLQ